MKKLTILSILFIIFVFTLPAQVFATTSAGVKPSSFIYFFDTAFENVGLFFTFGSENKAKKALEHADERLAEAEESANENNTKAVERAMTGYKEEISLATEKSKGLKDEKKAEELLNVVSENTAKHQEVLKGVLEKVPDGAKEAIIKAIEVSKNGQEEAMKQVAELKGEIERLKKEVEELKKESNNSKETEVEKLKKEVEELKKKQSTTQPTSKQPAPTVQSLQTEKKIEEKSKTITLPNGAVVEMDNNGNITRTIKEAPINTTSLLLNNSTLNNPVSSIKNPEYRFKILSFEPIYADIDYETPPNRALNHYKIEMQFNDENNVADSIDGNLKIFLDNKLFQGTSNTNLGEYPLSNLLIFDNFKETETKLSNSFIFKYTLSRFPKNQNELDNYFLTAIYKDQRYRIPIGKYFNFEHIIECDQLVSDFYNDDAIKKFSSFYTRETELNGLIKEYLNLAKEKQCYKSLRYQKMRYCFNDLPFQKVFSQCIGE